MDDALIELTAVSPERAELVKLRFFAGLNEAEIAGVLNISERSVQRQWSYTRAWLLAFRADRGSEDFLKYLAGLGRGNRFCG